MFINCLANTQLVDRQSIVETSKGNPHTTFTEDSLVYLLKRNFRFTKQLNYNISKKILYLRLFCSNKRSKYTLNI
ncbi:hypothetical protein MSATCC23557_3310 [Metamycoplasma salivarium]|nr:hypothetical protein MSATCC23557_3310 [Metamycoplasma salivarium]